MLYKPTFQVFQKLKINVQGECFSNKSEWSISQDITFFCIWYFIYYCSARIQGYQVPTLNTSLFPDPQTWNPASGWCDKPVANLFTYMNYFYYKIDRSYSFWLRIDYPFKVPPLLFVHFDWCFGACDRNKLFLRCHDRVHLWIILDLHLACGLEMWV